MQSCTKRVPAVGAYREGGEGCGGEGETRKNGRVGAGLVIRNERAICSGNPIWVEWEAMQGSVKVSAQVLEGLGLREGEPVRLEAVLEPDGQARLSRVSEFASIGDLMRKEDLREARERRRQMKEEGVGINYGKGFESMRFHPRFAEEVAKAAEQAGAGARPGLFAGRFLESVEEILERIQREEGLGEVVEGAIRRIEVEPSGEMIYFEEKEEEERWVYGLFHPSLSAARWIGKN